MTAVDLLGLLIPVTYFVLLGIEARFPARQFPKIRHWRWKGVFWLIVAGVLATVLPLLLPADWLAAHRLMDLSGLGVIGGAVVGYIVVSGLSYIWHRSAHTFPFMWRTFHQIHHSPQRVDMSGANVFHPLEMAGFILLGTTTTTLLLGLDPVAAALTGYIANFYSFFQHLNVRTPRWLGYLIQRPEAHCVHHQRDVHAWNYGDLPIWDLLLGTFRNPEDFAGEVGFDDAATRRIGAMLAFVDVNRPVAGPNSLGRKTPAAAE
jgi:sterol desaturase/sphingolipid hydroxylase (fatty acid hydroxylase superfamily)